MVGVGGTQIRVNLCAKNKNSSHYKCKFDFFLPILENLIFLTYFSKNEKLEIITQQEGIWFAVMIEKH